MLLLLCRRRATRSGGGGAAEHDTFDAISLRADRSSARALGPREKVRASQHMPVRAALSDLACVLCCVQIDRRDRNGGGASAVEDDALFGLSSNADIQSAIESAARFRRRVTRSQAQAGQVSASGGTFSCIALCALRVCPPLTSAGSSCSSAAPSAEPCTSRAAAFVCADVVSVCECLVTPTSGGVSCLCAHHDARARRVRRVARMSC